MYWCFFTISQYAVTSQSLICLTTLAFDHVSIREILLLKALFSLGFQDSILSWVLLCLKQLFLFLLQGPPSPPSRLWMLFPWVLPCFLLSSLLHRPGWTHTCHGFQSCSSSFLELQTQKMKRMFYFTIFCSKKTKHYTSQPGVHIQNFPQAILYCKYCFLIIFTSVL